MLMKLLYHLVALQLPFSPFLPSFSPPLTRDTLPKFIPPGTMVYYHWEFADKAGGRYVEPQQALTTVDTRFPWQHLTSGLLQVNWYNRSKDFGQAILSQASMSIDNISKTLGGGLLHPINLWVYETDLDFHGSLAPGSYEWVGGVAFPTLEEASIVATG